MPNDLVRALNNVRRLLEVRRYPPNVKRMINYIMTPPESM
jgi:hypothetical protein